MAQVVKEENRNGVIVRVYDNGMEKGLNGRIIRGPTSALITSETASDYHRMRKEKKRALVAAAANEEVSLDLIEKFGDDAYIAAIAQAQTRKAMSSKDPKSTEAARWVFSESGIGELSQEDGPAGGVSPGSSPRVLLLLAELVSRRGDESVIEGVEVP